ncbi:MAG: acetate/propionate family kinase [Alphaproteobacteria bacterium]|nr:acetate/propionate family kinase [Alphaproteobacteria bacterium]
MILTLNVGSSSIKFALFGAEGAVLRGAVDGVGQATPRLVVTRDGAKETTALPAGDHAGLIRDVLDRLSAATPGVRVEAVGHRIVHGGPDFAAPVLLDEGVMTALARLVPLAPLHQPHNLAGVRAAQAAFPGAAQVGCFDTAFHRGQPRLQDLFALPRRFFDEGVRRYGFHGLSYEYVSGALAAGWPAEAAGRVIIAHLGSGASMCALSAGRSVGSTMGFSALDGLPMGTRCGRIDPGVLLWMMREKGMDAAAIEKVLYTESGLKGLSGVSGDLRAVEAAGTPEAEEAIAYFVTRAQREIGGLAALLGGLDAIVFTGGIGENAVRVRAAICDGLGWLGLVLDPARNAGHGPRITADASRVAALVIPTDEEAMIARHTRGVVG